MTAIAVLKRARMRKRALRMTTLAFVALLGIALTAQAQARYKADLVESRLANPPAVLTAGRSFLINDAASNRGSASAGRSLTRYYLVSGRSVLGAGARRVPRLKRGQ